MLISSSVVFCSWGLIMNRLKIVNKVANPTGVHTKKNNLLFGDIISKSILNIQSVEPL